MRSRPRRKEVAEPRRRLEQGEREAKILAEGAAFFAEAGFSGTTRALAERLGVTQALLYRHSPSKQAIIDRVFQVRIGDSRNAEWDRLIADRSLPLADRLIRFYQAYRARSLANIQCSLSRGREHLCQALLLR
ncbi:MAG: helix-turn-helix transcriptional regulator [Proteobacteria bacterium]|nr:helix-turn-helix transcriptional regulator [Pseudomonadota bacterium]MBI3496126.1 helix-turn-helix transcriptional regulator [Pseudomonadota bacterium]